MPPYRAPDPDLPESWLPCWKSFARALRAIPRSEQTLKTYGGAVRHLAVFLAPAPALDAVTREQMELFMASLHRRLRPAGVAIQYRSLRRFFNWLVEEDELNVSPMKRMRQPKVPDEPLTVLELEEIGRLLQACQGRGFEDRRDAAIIRFLIDTGVRLAGAVGMRMEDVDLDRGTAIVRAKGGDLYMVHLGAKAVRDLDRYLRVRATHPAHEADAFWLGKRGPLTDSGLYQVVRRRARQAGLKVAKAVHVFRHSFSHHFRVEGGEEGDLQVLGGWKTRAMLDRYGRSRAQARAQAAHRRHSPGDRI